MRGKKLGIVEIISILIIIGLLSLLIIPSINSITKENKKDVFLENVKLIYNESYKNRKKDIEKGLSSDEYNNQYSKYLFENNYELKYASIFDEEGNIIYLCISDGTFYIELPLKEEKVTKDEFTSDNIKEGFKDCFKKDIKDEK